MAKTKETVETPAATTEVAELSTADLMKSLLADLSAEELAELKALTGQDAVSASRIPVLKVNYCDTLDTEGREIKKGNFVYDQSSKTVEVDVKDEDGEVSKEDRMENLGTDLGKSVRVTVLAQRQQYNYYNDNQKLRCSSQVFGKGETPVGSNLKHECRSGKCPRRGDDVKKEDKCSCQYIAYVLVKIGEELKPAMMYIKGNNFFPFTDYLKAAGPVPLFFAPTRMKTKAEKQGSVTYYPIEFTLELANAYPAIEREQYKEQAKGAIAQLEDTKKSNFQKQATKQIAAPGEGSNARDVSTIPEDDEAEIVF